LGYAGSSYFAAGQRGASIAAALVLSVRSRYEHMFVSERPKKFDWTAVRSFYEAGHSPRACQLRFGLSSGAWHAAVSRGDVSLRHPVRLKPRGKTRQEVARLLSAGLSQAEIAKALGVSRPTVCFHMRRLGIPAGVRPGKRYDWEAIRLYYEAGHSMTECRERFGFSRNAWAEAILRGAIRPRPRLEPIEAVLATGRRRSRSHVKLRLVMAGLKEQRCESCGLTEWRSRHIALELHHVNGDGLDNRLENLLLLCPNCHSQTDTWGGRNKLRSCSDQAGVSPQTPRT
jgi:DNA-binding CsgD family transcriptional regulator/5-methylcytosine-specific restriction endonuclease McrA